MIVKLTRNNLLPTGVQWVSDDRVQNDARKTNQKNTIEAFETTETKTSQNIDEIPIEKTRND